MYTIPRQYLYCEQTTSGSIVSALYRLDIRYTVYTILGQYPYCVQTIITQYWANTCMYRKRIPIQYRANFTLFPGYCPNEMLAVLLLSQHRVSSFKMVRPRAPCGARYMGTLLERGLPRRRTRNLVKEGNPICAWTNGIAQHQSAGN